jgi:hypothetical protein
MTLVSIPHRAGQANLAPVPHHPGQGRPGRGLRARRHRGAATNLRPDRGRARFPPGTSDRTDRASNRSMDHPSRPESADGPRRPRHQRNVPAPRPRLPVHQRVRRGLHRRRHPDPHQSTQSTPGERDPRTHDRKPCAASCSTGSWSSTNTTCTGSSRSIYTTSITHGHTEPSHNSHRPRPKPQPPPVINLADHQVLRRPILGGLTNEYQTAA